MRRLLFVLILLTFFVSGVSTAFAEVREYEPGERKPKPVRVEKPARVENPAGMAKLSGDKIVVGAMKFKGVPYKFGGQSPKGFDCSGFVWYVYRQHGKSLPRTADKQFEIGRKIAEKDLRQGDVVFFTTYEKGASHCGVYVGDGKFIHASSSRGVMVSSMSEKYWKARYLGARRII